MNDCLEQRLLKSVSDLASRHAFKVIMRLEGNDEQFKEAAEKSEEADQIFNGIVREIFHK